MSWHFGYLPLLRICLLCVAAWARWGWRRFLGHWSHSGGRSRVLVEASLAGERLLQ